MNTITMLDLEILLFIQKFLRSSFLTPIFRLITALGDFGSIWLLLSILLLFYKKTRRIGWYALLGYAICSIAVDVILKDWIQRPRPFVSYDKIIPLIKEPNSFSFPSGHAAKAFCVSFILYYLWNPRYGRIFLFVATLIAFSRLYLGVHFFSDVIGGLIVGWLIAKGVVWLYQYHHQELKT